MVNTKIEEFDKWVIDIRRHIHQNPEIEFETENTQEYIISKLNELNELDKKNRMKYKKIKNGLIVDLDLGGNVTIGYRADIDALKISPENEVKSQFNFTYISKTPGIMHACGHDSHVAIAMGLIRKVIENDQKKFKNNIRIFFQPGEEMPPGGAIDFIKEGALEGVSSMLCIHVHGLKKCHELSLRKNEMMGGACKFKLVFQGKAGHHGSPQENCCPIIMCSEFINLVITQIYQSTPPNTERVIGFGKIRGGEKENKTPEKVILEGTIRAIEIDVLKGMMEIMRNLFIQVHQSKYNLDFENDELKKNCEIEYVYPPTINNEKLTDKVVEIVKNNGFNINSNCKPSLGSDDFAMFYWKTKVPSCYIHLGTFNSEKGIVYTNHHPQFDIDESIMKTGIDALFCLLNEL